jgi:glycosyltransferase involved in cell wall biosynthesis
MGSVSVFIPCYKYGRFLRQCVESVLTQEHVDVRALIIDDASPDETPEMAARLLERDPRVAYRRHAENRGHIATYNEGLDWADGDYTVLLSADDLLTPGSLARAVKLLDGHPEVGLAYGRGIAFRSDQPPSWTRPASEECGWKILAGSEFLESCIACFCNPVCTPTAIVRTRLQKQLGGYRAELPHTGDMEMWMRFAVHAPLGVLDADQAYYRIHGSNMNLYWNGYNLNEHSIIDLKQRKAAFDILFRDHGDVIADHERIKLGVKDRLISWDAFWEASKLFEKGDLAGCQEWLDFALDVDPELRNRPEYARLRWKRRVGPSIWSALRPLVEYARGRTARCSEKLC